MKLLFSNDRQQEFFEDPKELKRTYGAINGKLIIRRLSELKAALILADMPRAARPHPLTHNRKGTFAVNLNHPHRLTFKPVPPSSDQKSIDTIEILEVIDYH